MDESSENKYTEYMDNPKAPKDKSPIDPRDEKRVRGEICVRGNEFVWLIDNFSKYLSLESGRSISSPTLAHPDYADGKWKVKLVLFPLCHYHVDCNHMSMQPCLQSDRYESGKGKFVCWLTRRTCINNTEMVNRQSFDAEFRNDRPFGPKHFVGRKKVEDSNYGCLRGDRIEIHCSVVVIEPSDSDDDSKWIKL